jgi:hypothetical protein
MMIEPENSLYTMQELANKRSVIAVVGQLAVAALDERRNLWNQKPAVIDRRYKNQTDPLP